MAGDQGEDIPMNECAIPAGNGRRKSVTQAILFLLLFGLMFFLLYGVQGNAEEVAARGRSAILWMVRRWRGEGGDFAHAWIVPFVSMFIVWWKRKELAAAPKETSRLGLALIVAALAMHWTGVRVQQTRISLFSMVCLLWAVPLYVYGRRAARLLAFPCAYLLFCIPLSFLNDITVPLRLFSAASAGFLIRGLGIAAARTGTLIRLDGMNVGVDDPCSGLRSLIAAAALTAVYAYFTQRRPWKQWLLFLSAVPLAVAGNIARITSVAVVAKTFDAERATVFYHDYSAYVVFTMVILLMIWLGGMLEKKGAGR